MRLTRRTLLAAASLAATRTGRSQPSATRRLRGQIDSVNQDTMRLTTRTGEKLNLKLASDLHVTEVVPTEVSAIKPGAFIGTTAVPQPDGTLKALEVHVFPESMRGAGEGHRPWDLAPQSTMTNGTVGDVKVADGRTLTLAYKGGEQRIYVPPGAPVVTFEPGSRDMLRPGAHVFVTAEEAADESLTATRIGVGKDGLVPPM